MKKDKRISAYMTVEVSLLFPLIITVIMCVLYLTFYSYNRTIAFQDGAICALYGKNFSYTKMEEAGQVERMYLVLERLNKDQYLLLNNVKQKVNIVGNYISVYQEGNVNIPLLSPEIMSKLSFSESIKVEKKRAVFHIRQIRKVKNDEL